MPFVEWIAFAFLTGITVFGVVGSLFELFSGERLSFRPPFLAGGHHVRAVTAPVFAGPLMLVNDAIDARAEGRITRAEFASCLLTGLVWTCSMGLAMLELAAFAVSR